MKTYQASLEKTLATALPPATARDVGAKRADQIRDAIRAAFEAGYKTHQLEEATAVAETKRRIESALPPSMLARGEKVWGN